MAEKITQTLFRFRSMRAPELLSSDSKTNYFITDADFDSSTFKAAVDGMGPTEIKREVLETEASSFTPLSPTAEDMSPGMYAFGNKCIRERNTITQSELATEAAGVSALSAGNLSTLWENLYYQTITQASPYEREILISMILGNHIKINIGSITTDDEAREWLRSRIVMPQYLFGFDNPYQASTTSNEDLINNALHEEHMNVAVSAVKMDQITKAKKEFDTYQRDYDESEKSTESTAVVSFSSSIKAEMVGATTTPFTDQATGFTFDIIDTSVFAGPSTTLSYTPSDQIDPTPIQANLGDEALFVLNDNNLLDLKTFSDVKIALESIEKKEADNAFNNTEFSLDSVEINGTAIPTCSLVNRYNQRYSYFMKAVKKADDKYGILITIDVANPCEKLSSMEAFLDGSGSPDFVTFKASNRHGVITIDITPGSYANILDSTTEIQLNGSIKMDSGLILTWDDMLDMSEGTKGMMTEGTNEISEMGVFVPSSFGLKRLGIAEYRRVESYLCCYLPGEVSHIENVMAREYKERSTRRLRTKDSTTTTSRDVETENLTDTTSTSRFDMQKEISEVLSNSVENGISSNSHSGFNASVNANFGTFGGASVGYDSSSDLASNFASSSSKEKSANQSSSFAQDVTLKALERVVSKVKEERVVKIIEEFEEQNRHGFDNRQGSEHISGVYRWVDKVYKNEIHNYGKRLQYEFMVPEPSAFHLIAKASGLSTSNNIPISKPIDPRKEEFGMLKPLKSAANINEGNYQQWAAVYKAEVQPPPAKTKLLGKTISRPEGTPWWEVKAITDQVTLPDGYGLRKAVVSGMYNWKTSWSHIDISIGDNTREYWGKMPKQLFLEDNKSLELDKYSESVPIGVQFTGIDGGMVTISLELIRKDELYATWQLETYNSILEAYEERLQEYKDAMTELEVKRGQILSDNPAYHRDIITTVMKKNCISYLIGHLNMGKTFTSGSKIRDFHVDLSEEMDQYAATVKFIEQAFEWDIMDYVFYPFYWASRKNWDKLYGHENDDPVFKAFLQAGFARTILTVRPGFEEAVLLYMETGMIWNGGEVPIIGDDMYLSIIQELKDPEYILDGAWETRIPSTLTLIQNDVIALEADGLPCYCDSETPPDESIIEPATNPLDSLEIHLGGTVA